MSVGRTSTPARIGQYAALLAYVVFLGFPLLWLAATAFKSTQEIALGAAGFLPEAPTLQNFSDALRRADLVEAGGTACGSRSPRRSSPRPSRCPRPTGWPASRRSCGR